MSIGPGERNTLLFLDRLYREGAQARAQAGQSWERAIQTIRGNVWPDRRPKYKLSAVMNFLSQVVERKAALITDSRPAISVQSRKMEKDPLCAILEKVIAAILDEKNFEQRLTEFVMLEEHFGFALFNTCWDSALDYGRGDIDLVVIDPRMFIFDPFVRRSWNLQHGEYCCLETSRPTEFLVDKYGRREDIKSDLSSIQSSERDSVLSMIRNFFGFDRLQNKETSVIPRSIVRDWFIRDRWTKNGDQPVFPNWRHTTVAGGCIADDGANPYIDGNHPYDGMEWGFDVNSAYGRNEVDLLESPQILFNKLLAGVMENAILMGNGIWVGDRDALTKEEWKTLSNEPGSIIKKKRGTDLHREAPQGLPPYIMGFGELLINGIEKLSGITEVTEGRRPGQVCVDDKTQCLTKRGWKFHHELIQTDEIYTFDAKTERGIWSPLIGIARYDWDDLLYTVETDRMSCAVTPNHGWMVGFTGRQENKTGLKKPRCTDKYHWTDVKYQRVEMQDINAGHFIPNEIRLMEQPSLFTDNFVELVGWIVTEGCFNISTRANGEQRYRVILTQSPIANPTTFVRLSNCLTQSGFHFSVHQDKRTDVVDFVIEGESARLLMQAIPEKRLGYDFICQLSPSQLDLLYDVMLDGDGSKYDPFNPKTQDAYFSADQELADQFQAVAVLKGKATHLTQCKEDIRTKSHKKEYYTNIKKVSCRREAQNKWRTLLKHLQFVQYKGIVWCPQTLTGTWIARRNGITYLTHNTSGVAIESLAIMAQTTLRLKARQLENLIQRIGQKLISRIFAYYNTDRIFNLIDNKGHPEVFLFERQKIQQAIQERGVTFQDYIFKVVPTSSLAMTKWQKGLMATQLYQLGLIDEEAALDALEYPNRDLIMKRMEEKKAQEAELMAQFNQQNNNGNNRGFGQKRAPQKMPKNLLRGNPHKETGMQYPQQ